MANHDNSKDKKTVERPDAGSGPDGTQSRPADAFAGEGSLADQLKKERERKAKRLKEITGGK